MIFLHLEIIEMSIFMFYIYKYKYKYKYKHTIKKKKKKIYIYILGGELFLGMFYFHNNISYTLSELTVSIELLIIPAN